MKINTKKIAEICKMIFGYGIMITLFSGGLTFFGFVLSLIVGGNFSIRVCDIIHTYIFPVIIYGASVLVLFGLITMYLSGETALTSSSKKDKKEEEQ